MLSRPEDPPPLEETHVGRGTRASPRKHRPENLWGGTGNGIFGVIGLVSCAVGGTSISQWQRGQFLYNQLVERANAALQDGGCIRAMLWYQGESDANDTSSAGSYGARLRQFFSDIRLDLDSALLPIVQVCTYTLIISFSINFP
ncbi:probable carbohydrate esterase at4g34215 [Phtheirospermum japonicum]|uniref:Probable carbohydrate esterase at4g34215 n=1 Tax=Phtheirospermum japonicum TaxID=374723 RepID=A0A830DHV0_9LAMI|nr:probable carbohydrate esterase at4g34215 [Phtheirospermum japonicum]